jgi:hypothetical protein
VINDAYMLQFLWVEVTVHDLFGGFIGLRHDVKGRNPREGPQVTELTRHPLQVQMSRVMEKAGTTLTCINLEPFVM